MLWNGNPEPPLWTFITDRQHVVRWAWTTYARSAERDCTSNIPELAGVRLTSRAEVARRAAANRCGSLTNEAAPKRRPHGARPDRSGAPRGPRATVMAISVPRPNAPHRRSNPKAVGPCPVGPITRDWVGIIRLNKGAGGGGAPGPAGLGSQAAVPGVMVVTVDTPAAT